MRCTHAIGTKTGEHMDIMDTLDKFDNYEYVIPDAVKNRVTLNFAETFITKLKETFSGVSAAEIAFNLTGTSGWSTAYHDTCDKLHQKFLSDYEDSLTWMEYDIFAFDITSLCIDLIIDEDLEIAKKIRKVMRASSDRVSDTEGLQG